MKVSVVYTSFNLRRDTESIVCTEGALRFFRDHSIPFTEEFVDSYSGAKENCILWRDDVMPFELDITSIEELTAYAVKYQLEFHIDETSNKIKF